MDFQNDPEYIVIIGWLQRNYPTAANPTEADEFLTTREITQAINTAFSKEYYEEDIHTLLVDQEYNSTNIGAMKRVWLIKKQNNA